MLWFVNSRPNERAVVKARGRVRRCPLVAEEITVFCEPMAKGAGDMSIAIDPCVMFGRRGVLDISVVVRTGDSGGEFKDIVEANESSKSEDKNSSSSFSGR